MKTINQLLPDNFGHIDSGPDGDADAVEHQQRQTEPAAQGDGQLDWRRVVHGGRLAVDLAAALRDIKRAGSGSCNACKPSVTPFTFDRMAPGYSPPTIKGLGVTMATEMAEHVLAQTKELARMSRQAGLVTLAI